MTIGARESLTNWKRGQLDHSFCTNARLRAGRVEDLNTPSKTVARMAEAASMA